MRAIVIGLLLSGCYIVEPGGGGGGDDVGPPPSDGGGGGAGPIGRTFTVSRSPTTPSCADFAEENRSHTIMVSATSVLVSGMAADQVSVRSQAAVEANFDSPNVEFRVFEEWTSSQGPAFPDVGYRLWINGNMMTGEAFATFAFAGTVCDYRWEVF